MPVEVKQLMRELMDQLEHINPALHGYAFKANGLSDIVAFTNSKRILSCQTLTGKLAVVHLERVGATENKTIARTVYKHIFDAHDVVMGDMNTRWKFMIEETGAVDAISHSYATLQSTYLPGHREPATWPNGDPKPGYQPPAFDLVVVKRPLATSCIEHMNDKHAVLGPKIPPLLIPRTFMKTTGWFSDHVPVMAKVRATVGAQITVATWNVADPHYFAQWWPDAGFGFEQDKEEERVRLVEKHVHKLLAVCDVVGLQEVPVAIVSSLIAHAVAMGFEVKWVSAPSETDTNFASLLDVFGIYGYSAMLPSARAPIPPVPHLMLFWLPADAIEGRRRQENMAREAAEVKEAAAAESRKAVAADKAKAKELAQLEAQMRTDAVLEADMEAKKQQKQMQELERRARQSKRGKGKATTSSKAVDAKMVAARAAALARYQTNSLRSASKEATPVSSTSSDTATPID